MYRSHGVEGSFATRLSATADDQSSRSVSSPSLHLSLFGRRSVSLPPRDSSSASARILRGGRRGFERSRARRRVRVFALRRFSLLRRQAPPLASQFPPEFVVPPLIRGGDGGLHAFERLFEMRGCDERRRRRGVASAAAFAPASPPPAAILARSLASSCAVAAARFPLSAATHASRTRLAKSAPLNPPHLPLSPTRATSSPGARGVFRVSVLRIAARPSGGGNGTYRSLSSRPGRSIAGSIMSGRFVAATTNVADRASSPSISVRSWFTTRSLAWLPESFPRRGASESSSSKKSTHGAAARARAKRVRTARSLSPTYLLSSSGPLMEMKFALASFAVALATSVLPHPGGPYRSTPVDTARPIAWNLAGCAMGSTTLNASSSRTSVSEPTSSHVTSGVVVNPSRCAEGCTRVSASAKSSVVMASEESSSTSRGRRSPSLPPPIRPDPAPASGAFALRRRRPPHPPTW